MQEMSKKGLDPILDYHKFVKQKQLEVKEAKAKEEQAKVQQEQVVKQAQEKYTSDVNDFKSKNPEIDVEKELWQNTKFMKFADGKIGRYALDTIYRDYVAFTSEYENNAKEKAKQMVAINRTSSGSLTGAEVSQKTKDYASMSKEDFEREYKKITGR
jgi:type II secretory pathway pseudopilin PulG